MRKYNKLLILSDSFKNSISSKDIGEIGKRIFKQALPNLDVETFRIADGGEGTVDFFINELGYQKVTIETINCFKQNINTYYGVKNDTAVFDVASCVGFLVNDHLDLWHASTYGIGIVLKAIIEKGYKKIYLGLGGSITNDGGMGILGAMGAKFYLDKEEVIPFNDHSVLFNKVDLTDVFKLCENVQIIGLCDVNNPLLGDRGATFTYGPQKGGNDETLKKLENWMEQYTKCFDADPNVPGSGAAGGIGYCLNILGSSLVSGIKVMLDELKLVDKLDSNTLLITGEGALDHTSFQGKIIGFLLDLTKKHQTDTIIICGINKMDKLIKNVYPLHEKPVDNYQETVYYDVERVFNKILKDHYIDFVDYTWKEFNTLPDDILDLRKEVFVKEQGIPEELEFDQYDEASIHLGLYIENQLVGTIRLIEINDDLCKIGRFVVKQAYRGFGIGKLICLHVLNTTKYQSFIVHAQTNKIGFYQKCGFVVCGSEFMEDGIPHIKMIKNR